MLNTCIFQDEINVFQGDKLVKREINSLNELGAGRGGHRLQNVDEDKPRQKYTMKFFEGEISLTDSNRKRNS